MNLLVIAAHRLDQFFIIEQRKLLCRWISRVSILLACAYPIQAVVQEWILYGWLMGRYNRA